MILTRTILRLDFPRQIQKIHTHEGEKKDVYQSIRGWRFRHAVCRIYGLYGVHSDRCFPDGDEKKKITDFLSFVH